MGTPTISTFPNGQQLQSSANTPDTINTIFQAVIAQILGFTLAIETNQILTANPQSLEISEDIRALAIPAWNAVRVGWQLKGQPKAGVNDNVCVIRSTTVDTPYTRTRDQLQPTAGVNPVSYTLYMGYAQIWNIHVESNGPNGAANAQLIIDAITLQWVRDLLQAQNLYLCVAPPRYKYIPYQLGSLWGKRADVDFRFTEQVFQSIVEPVASSLTIIVDTDYGDTETINVNNG